MIVFGILGLAMLVAASKANAAPRILVGILCLAGAAVMGWLAQLGAVTHQHVHRMEVELSGDVSLENMQCQQCGAELGSESVNVAAGAVFVKCALSWRGIPNRRTSEMVSLLRSISRDMARFRARWHPLAPLTPGLYTYRFQPPGGQVRVHLRIEPDQSSVLFVDVTDVVHLNPTATRIAKWALEGYSAANICDREFPASTFTGTGYESAQDAESIVGMVDRFREPQRGCPTCALDQVLRRVELFATRIRAPYKADLAITYACNNDCPHCYNEGRSAAAQSLDCRGVEVKS